MAIHHRIIYYYQTFKSILPALAPGTPVTDIHIAAIHFGRDPDTNEPYIHLNDHPPNAIIFLPVWREMEAAVELGINVILMIGGEGGAFINLFSDFDTYYPFLKSTIRQFPMISGVDLDIEESVSLDDVKSLIRRVKSDFGSSFSISMAPMQYSLQTDEKGMGDFSYKTLFDSPEGKLIDYFNGQFYIDYSAPAYEEAVNNDYPPHQVVMGMISGQDLEDAKEAILALCKKYPTFGGVYVWEYFDAPPGKTRHPEEWCHEIKQIYEEAQPYAIPFRHERRTRYCRIL